jgi:autotransporter adhesin
MSVRSVMGALGLVILGAFSTASTACIVAPGGEPTAEGEPTTEAGAAVAKGSAADDKVGQACHVTEGGNKGKSGTYTNDVDGLNCSGSWGSTGCAGYNGANRCSDGAKPAPLPSPTIVQSPIGTAFVH